MTIKEHSKEKIETEDKNAIGPSTGIDKKESLIYWAVFSVISLGILTIIYQAVRLLGIF